MPAPKWAVGMQQLVPGVYLDAANGLHVDAHELCVANGFAPTPENAAMLQSVFDDMVRARWGDIPITHVDGE